MKDQCAVGCICVYKCCSSRVSRFAMVAAVDAAAVVAVFAVAVAVGNAFAAAADVFSMKH